MNTEEWSPYVMERLFGRLFFPRQSVYEKGEKKQVNKAYGVSILIALEAIYDHSRELRANDPA